MDNAALVLRPLDASDSITALTALLHRAYKALADAGMRFHASHQSDDVTRERIARGRCLVGAVAGRVVATVTWYPPGHSSGTPWYERAGVATLGQLAVEPSLQGRGYARVLLEAAERAAAEAGATDMALDTSERAAELIATYTRRGYRFVEHVQWDVTNYRSVVLSKPLS